MVAICQAEGYSTAFFSLVNTIRLLTSSLTLFILPKWIYGKWAPRLQYIVIICSALLFGGFAMGAFYQSPEGWYLTDVLMGLGSALFNMNQAYIIGRWYKRKANFFIGLAGASSGAAGLIFNPVASWLISLVGWRLALLILCGTAFAAMSYGGAHMYLTPEEVHCEAYGSDEPSQSEQGSDRFPDEIIYPHRTSVLLCEMMLVLYFSANSLALCLPHLPNYATELGYALTISSLFSSLAMAGNITGKITLGILYDRFDWRKVTAVIFGLLACSCFGICLAGHQLSIALMGWSFDITGSYHTSFVFLGTALLIATSLLLVIFRLYHQGERITYQAH